jgi:hypothetical protein
MLGKKILLYGFSEGNGNMQAENLAFKVRKMGVEVVPVAKRDYLRTLGEAAGIPGTKMLGVPSVLRGEYQGPDLPVRMIVMAGVTSREMDELLAIFPTCGITKNDLKAMLTPVNAQWNALGLSHELMDEHRMMGEQR